MATIALTVADKVEVDSLTVLQHTFVASSAITAGAPCYVVAATGKAAHSDANGAAPLNSVWGIATKTAAAGESVTLVRVGYMSGWTLDGDYDAPVYLSDTVGRLDTAAGTRPVVLATIVPALQVTLGTAADKILLVDCTGAGTVSSAGLTDSSGGTASATIAATTGVSSMTIPLTSLATGLSTAAIDLLTAYTPGYRFKVLGLHFVTTVAGTGTSASQVFNLEIGTTNVTGGVLTLLLADTDTIGKVTAATAVTAANVGTASDTISLEMAASGTVFTAGAGYFVVRIQNMDTADAFASLASAL